jgi:hypothetical protein
MTDHVVTDQTLQQQRKLLLLIERERGDSAPRQTLLEHLPVLQRRPTTLSDGDVNDTAVDPRGTTLDQPALFEAIDQPGRGRA